MGESRFLGTPEEWDALVKKNNKSTQTDEKGQPLTYWGGLVEPKFDLEKEMFELEHMLDIPSHLRYHNSKPDRTCTNNCSTICGECQILNISEDCEEVKNWDSFVEKKNNELVIEKLAEISSELQEATYTQPHKTTYKHGFIDGYNKAKETLYTKDQLIGAIDFARGKYANLLPKEITDIQFIESLKKD